MSGQNFYFSFSIENIHFVLKDEDCFADLLRHVLCFDKRKPISNISLYLFLFWRKSCKSNLAVLVLEKTKAIPMCHLQSTQLTQ